jgi:hypothetical protein
MWSREVDIREAGDGHGGDHCPSIVGPPPKPDPRAGGTARGLCWRGELLGADRDRPSCGKSCPGALPVPTGSPSADVPAASALGGANVSRTGNARALVVVARRIAGQIAGRSADEAEDQARTPSGAVGQLGRPGLPGVPTDGDSRLDQHASTVSRGEQADGTLTTARRDRTSPGHHEILAALALLVRKEL